MKGFTVKYETRYCNICTAHNDKNFLTATSIAYIDNEWIPIKSYVTRCRICSLVYNNIIPNKKSLSLIYERSSYSNRDKNPTHIKNIQEQVKYVKRFFSRKNYVSLDVGSALDKFSEILRAEGWQAYEIEPSSVSMAYNGLNGKFIFHQNVEEFQGSKKFDLISLRHVLEHLRNPINVLKKLSGNLSPNGKVFIEVPNLRKAKPLDVNSFFRFLHLYHFTPNSLSNILKKSGYEIIDSDDKINYGAIRIIAVRPKSIKNRKLIIDQDIKRILDKYFITESKTRGHILHRLRNIVKSKKSKILLWGAGFHSEIILQLADKKLRDSIECFVDSDKLKWGKLFYGKLIRSPEWCITSDLPIVISSLISQESIEQSILSYKITKSRINKLYSYKIPRY